MKKIFSLIFCLCFLFIAVPAFSQFIAGVDYFNFKYEENSSSMFGGYVGYDLGDFEVSLSYYQWSYSDSITFGTYTYNWTLNLKPMHLNAIYKFKLPNNPNWVPFAGVGYGNTDFSISGYEEDSEKYNSWLWMVGVRYYFNPQFSLNLTYMSTTVDVEGHSFDGSGYGIGGSYRF
ncbi:MAG TPA: porin family protein [Firmicutes bacterium]|nr:porin family protein [Bacillota bacterium]